MVFRSRQQGVSIIELIAFIVIIGIIGTVILIPLGTMLRDSEDNDQLNVAMMLANATMEWRWGQREHQQWSDFPNGTSTCTQEICTFIPIPDGYSVITTIATGWSSSTNYKQITVTVTGNKLGQGSATLKSLFAKY